MFDWREDVELARDLSTRTPGSSISVRTSEATARCAVSRAYYGAFCHARNYARSHLGFVPTNKGADHWLLRQHFVNIGMPDVARRLQQLHGWRKLCDYNDRVPYLATTVARALREAAAVIQ